MVRKKMKFSEKELLINSKLNQLLFKISDFIYPNLNKLYFIPLLIFLVSITLPFYNYFNKGEFINKDFTLTGGLKISFDNKYLNKELIDELNKYSNINIEKTSNIVNIVWQGKDYNLEKIKNLLENNGIKNYNLEEISPLLGENFLNNLLVSLLLSLLFIVVVLFYLYRDIKVASTAIRALLFNLIITLSITNVLIPLSITTLPAYLMILGYGIDTNITLINHFLKEKKLDKKDRYKLAFNTGVMMDLTTIIVLLVGVLLANNIILKSIFFVLLIGIIVDLLDTWLLNGYLLKKLVKD